MVFAGLAITKLFSFPSYEEEKEYNDLKHLAQLEGISVDEYVSNENDRAKFYANRRSTTETIVDAIHLNRMKELPAALADVKKLFAEDYSQWPYLYSEAIKANNMVAFKWLIKQRVPCDYKTHNLGGMGFYTAIEKREITFFEVLLQKGCDVRNKPKQVSIHSKIKRMKDQEWLDLLYSYYPKVSLE